MFDKFANIFRIPDLRKRVLFTLGLLAVYRIGGHIPIPGVNIAAASSNTSSRTRDRCWALWISSPAATSGA